MPTSVYNFTRNWIAIEETTRGVTPLNSPTGWFQTGFTKLTPGIATEHREIHMPGSRKTYADIIGRRTDTLNVTYFPFDTKMIRMGMLYGGAGTNEKSLSILQSYKIGATQLYDLYQGCVTTTHTLEIPEDGIYMCTQTFQNSFTKLRQTQAEIDALIGTVGGGLGFPAALTARPKTNLDGPTTPFLLDGSAVKFKEGTLTTSWELLEARPQGNQQPTDLDVGKQTVEFEFTTWAELTPDVLGDFEGFAPLDATYELWSGTPDCILTLNGFLQNNYESDWDTEAGAFVEESYTGTIEDATITAIP